MIPPLGGALLTPLVPRLSMVATKGDPRGPTERKGSEHRRRCSGADCGSADDWIVENVWPEDAVVTAARIPYPPHGIATWQRTGADASKFEAGA